MASYIERIQKLQAEFNALPDMTGITWPSPGDVVKQRIASQPGVSTFTLSQVPDDSPALGSVSLEIETVKAQFNMILQNLPLLGSAVSIPIALATIKPLLPVVIKELINLGIKIPEPLLTTLEGAGKLLDDAQTIIDEASNVLSTLPGGTQLGGILGIKHS